METFEVADGVKKFTSQFLFVIRFESSNFVLYLHEFSESLPSLPRLFAFH